MDTVAITQTITTVSVRAEVYGKLPPLLWFVLFFGLTVYWVFKLRENNDANLDKTIKQRLGIFVSQNWIEVPISIMGCIAFALFNDLPKESMSGVVITGMVFASGYGGSSFLNNLVTKTKVKEGLTSLVKKKTDEGK